MHARTLQVLSQLTLTHAGPQERDRICSALRREAVRMRSRLIQARKHGKREPAVMPTWTEAFVEVRRLAGARMRCGVIA